MRILVTEFVCGGGWPDGPVPESLAREGRAMLLAVVADLSELPGTSVVTTWDERLGPAPRAKRVEVHVVQESSREGPLLDQLAAEADASLVIAPELGGLLARRIDDVARRSKKSLNALPATVRVCGDKLAMFRICQAHELPTIPTRIPGTSLPWSDCVVKLRDGAGSQEMKRFQSADDYDEFRKSADLTRFLIQPFIRGRSLSVAALFAEGQLQFMLPIAAQRIQDDGEFQYMGGNIPATDIDRAVVLDLVSRLGQVLPGLHGYIGFDLILAEELTPSLRLVEINPRLTTSYIGYRALCRENLAAWLVDPGRLPGPEFRGSIAFAADGTRLEHLG